MPAPSELIRVLSIPSSHVYVWHLAHPDGEDGVVRLPDPVVDPSNPMSPWWPPPALHPDWLTEHRDEFDLVHVHFGFDACEPQQLAEFVRTLRKLGKPLVYTLHDLRNPHHHDRGLHDAHLDVLVPESDALVTLTSGAAAEIRRRWQRTAIVLPHPHVVPLDLLDRPRPRRERPVVGLHLKSVRANMAPFEVLDALVDAVGARPDAVLQVNIHDEVMDPASPLFLREVASYLHDLATRRRIDLRVHPFFSDDELWDYFLGLDLSVLPYRFGTHSGWLEACYDLGTPVLAPDCGCYADQRPCLLYRHGDDGLDVASVHEAVGTALCERPAWRARREDRLRERAALAHAHRRLYEQALDREAS